MPLRWMQLDRRYPIVRSSDATRAGVPPDVVATRRLGPKDLRLGDYVTVPVEDYWIERALGDEWTAACRFTVQDGQPVISELRIFPVKHDSIGPDFLLSEATARQLGEWAAELRGHLATAPRGGLSARVFHSFKPGELLRRTRQDLDELRRHSPGLFRDHMGFAPFTAAAARAALAERRPGRKGHGLAFFAQLAADYARRLRSGDPRPVAAIATARQANRQTVASWLFRARRAGLLTPALLQGQRGGELTPKAKALLGVAKRAKSAKGKPRPPRRKR